MQIIPAIDIKGGACVRLVKGDPNQATVYSSDPLQMARSMAEKGAKRIHVVDLDGAFSGKPHYLDLVGKMKKEVPCEFQLGGGLREKDSIKKALQLGIDKLILGTAALEKNSWVQGALDWHQDRLIVAIDVNDNKVNIEGWKEGLMMPVSQAVERVESMGFLETIYTDISRDGTLAGPNLSGIEVMIKSTRMGVFASGGVSKMDDILALRKISGLKGVIVGKALYNGNIQLEDCFAPQVN